MYRSLILLIILFFPVHIIYSQGSERITSEKAVELAVENNLEN